MSAEKTTRFLDLRSVPNRLESQDAFYQSSRNDEDRLVLSIVDIETEHIGVCNLGSTNWVHRDTDMTLIISDKDFQSGPHIVEATANTVTLYMSSSLRHTVDPIFQRYPVFINLSGLSTKPSKDLRNIRHDVSQACFSLSLVWSRD